MAIIATYLQQIGHLEATHLQQIGHLEAGVFVIEAESDRDSSGSLAVSGSDDVAMATTGDASQTVIRRVITTTPDHFNGIVTPLTMH